MEQKASSVIALKPEGEAGAGGNTVAAQIDVFLKRLSAAHSGNPDEIRLPLRAVPEKAQRSALAANDTAQDSHSAGAAFRLIKCAGRGNDSLIGDILYHCSISKGEPGLLHVANRVQWIHRNQVLRSAEKIERRIDKIAESRVVILIGEGCG